MADTTDSSSESWSLVEGEAEVEVNGVVSVESTLSWNTFLSRTSVSSLSCAIFSEQQSQAVHGLEDVFRLMKTLNLPRYRYEELVREESLGEGETYIVERCVAGKTVFAVKHLKAKGAVNDKAFRQRLKSVILEVQIMKHGPLRTHPNFPSAEGYGWNVRGSRIIPYILVEYAPLGTLRQYFQKLNRAPLPRDIEILVGDVASALSALHTCGIVHGDVKLDNVLVFPSWDRPSKALAKLTDFGHALIMNDKSRKRESGQMRYGGTLIYNAPEVQNQDYYPIDRADLPKCDIWSFGLLLWEACLGGKEYLACIEESRGNNKEANSDDVIRPGELLRLAKHSVPGGTNSLGSPMFIRITLHRTLQEDPAQRVPNGRRITISDMWHVSGLKGLEADLALHLEAPTPTYEMFRSENGREIPWAHEEQIFRGLKQTHAENLAKDSSSIAWQIALCYHVGFGVPRNPESAHHYAEIAKAESHPVATTFAGVLRLGKDTTADTEQRQYATRVSKLLRLTSMAQEMPLLIKSCFDGYSEWVLNLLTIGHCPNSTTLDGCTVFHWLFMLEDAAAIEAVAKRLRLCPSRVLVNAPTNIIREAHSQWPLQLSGTPLAVAVSVNCLDTVKALLSLGADPMCPVYHEGQFPPGEPRSSWTALHLATKYHCAEILAELLKHASPEKLQPLEPLPCALSFSTSLELVAMHGRDRLNQLKKTIALSSKIHPLSATTSSGMTALMQAIDFQDHDVVAALLETEPELASAELRSRLDPKLFNLPIHFAAQIAARRDAPETLVIPKLINSYSHGLNPSKQPPRDNLKRTPLHLAVTGPSSRTARWILEERIGFLQVEDELGRTPLHCCASVTNLDLLLSKGASVNHADRYGMTALHRACFLGEFELVQGFLKHKPKLDLSNNQYGTPLHCAILAGSIDVALALLDAGAPIDATDKRGNTPIHVAARLDRHAMLRILMQRGADITLRNYNDRDARLIAASTGRLGSVGVLRILSQGWGDLANKKILEIKPEEYRGRFELTSTKRRETNLRSDFLWERGKRGTMPDRNEETRTFTAPSASQMGESYEEKGKESFDEQEVKMTRFESIFERLKNEHFPWVDNSFWIATQTMALMSVYFDEGVWRAPLSGKIMEIMAYTVLDLSTILKGAKVLGPGGGEMLQKTSLPNDKDAMCRRTGQAKLEATETRTDGTNSTTGALTATDTLQVQKLGAGDEPMDLDSSGGAATPQGSGMELDLEVESQPIGDQPGEVSGEVSEKRPAPVERAETADLKARAAHHVAAIVEASRPASAFPGRSKLDIEEVILWELRRMQDYAEPGKWRSRSGSGPNSMLFERFPQLARHEFGSRQYLKWRTARNMAARLTRSRASTGNSWAKNVWASH
ncbi:putative serine threonine protein kinase [Rosellinia necatrix]|uniref:Putative serine threonine protein kinase n=1 Tax=Rosellinia necatrix TaxID=77044 RepID=A0A1S7UH94_ROSNE|nr:putative serine threonine protein kinase [Rosellinia necatrix]